jgi:[histone H3]-lysine36 N-dimethyltransferase SETMAR
MTLPIDKTHLRHSLLFVFDAIRAGRIKGGDEAKAAAEWLNSIYGAGTVSESTCMRWFRKFRDGERGLEDAERSGRPSDFSDDQLRQLIEEDDTLTTGELATIFECSDETVRTHLHTIGKVGESR